MAAGDISTIQGAIKVNKDTPVAIADLGINIVTASFTILDTSLVETSRSGDTVFMNVIFTVLALS